MSKEQRKTEIKRVPLSSLYDRLLSRLDTEIESLQETLQEVSPEKKLDFISKTLPLLLKYRESGEGDPENRWVEKWGD